MPRSRSSEGPQRQSPRSQLNTLRTSSSDSDPLHHRPKTEKSPKLAEGRSPRGAQSDPAHPKKLGTRIADLESQLGQAQTELKSLKTQLSSAEAAKKSAQEQLDKKPKKSQKVASEKRSVPIVSKEHSDKENVSNETSDDAVEKETDVFEVPVEQPKSEMELPDVKEEPVTHSDVKESENLPIDDIVVKNDEINSLKSKLEDKEKELECYRQENESLKTQLNEKSVKISSAESEIEELTMKMIIVDQELEKSKINASMMNEKLLATEKAKEELENEMKMLRVQTEQWRKAADAAASVLASGADMNGRRISERCGSMDKHYGNGFEHVSGYRGYADSPGYGDDSDDVFASGKRKGSGMKMFGDLWKKKGQK